MSPWVRTARIEADSVPGLTPHARASPPSPAWAGPTPATDRFDSLTSRWRWPIPTRA
jgi:hypothetical protein